MTTTPAATHMRFSDDGSSRSSREAYATTKAWTLPGTYGTKTVYVQFDSNGDTTSDAKTSDSISYTSEAWWWAATWTLTLIIAGWIRSCTYSESLAIAQTSTASFSQQVLSGTFASGFVCTDLKWADASWNLTIQTNILTNSSNGAYTIPAANVQFKTDTSTVTDGNCNIYAWTTGYTTINTTQTILGKNSDIWAICIITAPNPKIKVTIPANTAVGTYTSTLTYTLT